MSKKNPLKPIAGAIGATLVATLATAPMAGAAGNPFAANDIGSGYMVADSHMDGNCGANKGGTEGDKAGKDGNCGANKEQAADKAKKEGQCGEGKCGGNK